MGETAGIPVLDFRLFCEKHRVTKHSRTNGEKQPEEGQRKIGKHRLESRNPPSVGQAVRQLVFGGGKPRCPWKLPLFESIVFSFFRRVGYFENHPI